MISFFRSRGPFTIGEVCSVLQRAVPDSVDGSRLVHHAKALNQAEPQDVTFLFNKQYLDALTQTRAGFCLVEEAYAQHVPAHTVALITKQPYRDWALVLKHFYEDQACVAEGVSPLASIHPTAKLGQNVSLGAYTNIGAHVVVEDNTVIEDHVSVQWGVQLGAYCHIQAHVTLSHCHIGNHVKIKPGSRIGQSGFGFHMDEKGHVDVPQLGMVLIGDHAEIGSNVCIDRGSMNNTVIGKGVRIDNLVQIAHNVEVGDQSVLVAQVGIAGSTKLGKFVIAAGQVGIAGHLNIGDGVRIAAQSGLMRSVEAGQTICGSPAIPAGDFFRQIAALNKLVKERKV